MQMRLVSLTFALLCAAIPAGAAEAASSANEARAWIKRMSQAVINLNYDGVLEHRWDGGRESLRVIHRMRDGRMTERVVFFASGNETYRNGSSFIEYDRTKSIAKAQKLTRSFGYLSAFNGITADSDSLYDIRSSGTRRLKDYPGQTQMISVVPRDSLRYGYRFWLDKQNAMPIKTQLVNARGEVIDEIFFQALSLREPIDDEDLKPAFDVGKFKWRKPEALSVKQAFRPRSSLLPTGFRLLNINPDESRPGASGPQTRFIVSDGIAWVSVFVSVADKPQLEGLQPFAPSGTYTWVSRLDGHYINVVGEVPPATVQKIAEAVRPE
jgi:sigma-E factor negative regulatory protein RseB